MKNNIKIIKTEKLILKLKKCIEKAINNKNYNRAMAAICSAAKILYDYNQRYIDEDLEKYIKDIANLLVSDKKLFENSNENVVLVYDGFGEDVRGVIKMYLEALGKNDYEVIYVSCPLTRSENLPEIKKICDKYSFTFEVISYDDTYFSKINKLIDIFNKYSPASAFYYTYPYDVTGAVGFACFDKIVKRYLIDLTDHAFWLGKASNDYFLGSRNMSAYIEFYERKIPKNQLIKLGVNLLVEEVNDHSGLPFDVLKEKYVFSGGALYKTLGDENNYYYRIIDYILSQNDEIKFIYAGNGDSCELDKIVKKYPMRAYHISERKDYFYLIKNCLFYLNTYPMFGGMMMKYAALAKKLPITLKHNSDSDGLLLHQDKCKIEYNSFEELISDVKELIDNKDYLKEREALLEGSVITEQRFINNIRGVIDNQKTDYEHEFVTYDTKKFREEFLERYNYKEASISFVNKENFSLFSSFPFIFMKGLILKKIKKRGN